MGSGGTGGGADDGGGGPSHNCVSRHGAQGGGGRHTGAESQPWCSTSRCHREAGMPFRNDLYTEMLKGALRASRAMAEGNSIW